jgi:hypothetical protein
MLKPSYALHSPLTALRRSAGPEKSRGFVMLQPASRLIVQSEPDPLGMIVVRAGDAEYHVFYEDLVARGTVVRSASAI